jgi:hypothetical protein
MLPESHGHVVRDRWSPSFALISAVALSMLIWSMRADSAAGIFSLFSAIAVLVVGGVWIVLDLVRWRVRHATSILAGMGLLSLGLYIPHPDDQILDDQLMRARMPEFEALVSAKRAEMTAPGPVRMVVYYKDRSLFVTANLFEFVIYDETDQIELSPQTALGVWAYPGFKQV